MSAAALPSPQLRQLVLAFKPVSMLMMTAATTLGLFTLALMLTPALAEESIVAWQDILPHLDTFSSYEDMQRYFDHRNQRSLRHLENPSADTYVEAFNRHNEQRVQRPKRSTDMKETKVFAKQPTLIRFEMADAVEPSDEVKDLIRQYRSREINGHSKSITASEDNKNQPPKPKPIFKRNPANMSRIPKNPLVKTKSTMTRAKRATVLQQPANFKVHLIPFEASDAREPNEQTKAMIKRLRALDIEKITKDIPEPDLPSVTHLSTATTKKPLAKRSKYNKTRKPKPKRLKRDAPEMIKFELTDAKDPDPSLKTFMNSNANAGRDSKELKLEDIEQESSESQVVDQKSQASKRFFAYKDPIKVKKSVPAMPHDVQNIISHIIKNQNSGKAQVKYLPAKQVDYNQLKLAYQAPKGGAVGYGNAGDVYANYVAAPAKAEQVQVQIHSVPVVEKVRYVYTPVAVGGGGDAGGGHGGGYGGGYVDGHGGGGYVGGGGYGGGHAGGYGGAHGGAYAGGGHGGQAEGQIAYVHGVAAGYGGQEAGHAGGGYGGYAADAGKAAGYAGGGYAGHAGGAAGHAGGGYAGQAADAGKAGGYAGGGYAGEAAEAGKGGGYAGGGYEGQAAEAGKGGGYGGGGYEGQAAEAGKGGGYGGGGYEGQAADAGKAGGYAGGGYAGHAGGAAGHIGGGYAGHAGGAAISHPIVVAEPAGGQKAAEVVAYAAEAPAAEGGKAEANEVIKDVAAPQFNAAKAVAQFEVEPTVEQYSKVYTNNVQTENFNLKLYSPQALLLKAQAEAKAQVEAIKAENEKAAALLAKNAGGGKQGGGGGGGHYGGGGGGGGAEGQGPVIKIEYHAPADSLKGNYKEMAEFKQLSSLVGKSPEDQIHGLTYLLAKEMQTRLHSQRQQNYGAEAGGKAQAGYAAEGKPQENKAPVLFQPQEEAYGGGGGYGGGGHGGAAAYGGGGGHGGAAAYGGGGHGGAAAYGGGGHGGAGYAAGGHGGGGYAAGGHGGGGYAAGGHGGAAAYGGGGHGGGGYAAGGHGGAAAYGGGGHGGAGGGEGEAAAAPQPAKYFGMGKSKQYIPVIEQAPSDDYKAAAAALAIAGKGAIDKDAGGAGGGGGGKAGAPQSYIAYGLSPNYKGFSSIKAAAAPAAGGGGKGVDLANLGYLGAGAQNGLHEAGYDSAIQKLQSYASKYAFGYRIRDFSTGNDFGHKQNRDLNGVTRGQYHILLPDGRVQNVIYHADDTGFHADVSFESGQ